MLDQRSEPRLTCRDRLVARLPGRSSLVRPVSAPAQPGDHGDHGDHGDNRDTIGKLVRIPRLSGEVGVQRCERFDKGDAGDDDGPQIRILRRGRARGGTGDDLRDGLPKPIERRPTQLDVVVDLRVSPGEKVEVPRHMGADGLDLVQALRRRSRVGLRHTGEQTHPLCLGRHLGQAHLLQTGGVRPSVHTRHDPPRRQGDTERDEDPCPGPHL